MGDFFRFSENFENSKGKFTLEVNNTEKFRLRRAKINEFQQNSIENRSNLAKIAPEGREIFWGVFWTNIFYVFEKVIKKTLWVILTKSVANIKPTQIETEWNAR